MGSENGVRRSFAAQTTERLVRRTGSDDTVAADEAKFIMEEVVRVEFAGIRETFDMTIDGSHWFASPIVARHSVNLERERRELLFAPGRAGKTTAGDVFL